MKVQPQPAASPAQHQKLTLQARKWVSQTFFGEMLKQMHNSPFKSELFSGGRGGQAFSSLLDQHLADRMSRGAGEKLVGAIVRKLEARQAHKESMIYGAAPAPTGDAKTDLRA